MPSMAASTRFQRESAAWRHHVVRHDFTAALDCTSYREDIDDHRYQLFLGSARNRLAAASTAPGNGVLDIDDENGSTVRRHTVHSVAKPGDEKLLDYGGGTHLFRLAAEEAGTWLDRLHYAGQIHRPTKQRICRLHDVLADVVDIVVCLMTFEAPSGALCEELSSLRAKKGRLNGDDAHLLRVLWSAAFGDGLPPPLRAIISHARQKFDEAAYLLGPATSKLGLISTMQALVHDVTGMPLVVLRSCWRDAMELEAKRMLQDALLRPDERVLIYKREASSARPTRLETTRRSAAVEDQTVTLVTEDAPRKKPLQLDPAKARAAADRHSPDPIVSLLEATSTNPTGRDPRRAAPGKISKRSTVENKAAGRPQTTKQQTKIAQSLLSTPIEDESISVNPRAITAIVRNCSSPILDPPNDSPAEAGGHPSQSRKQTRISSAVIKNKDLRRSSGGLLSRRFAPASSQSTAKLLSESSAPHNKNPSLKPKPDAGTTEAVAVSKGVAVSSGRITKRRLTLRTPRNDPTKKFILDY